MRTLLASNDDVGVRNDGRIYVGVKIMRDGDGKLGPHGLSDAADDLGIPTRKTVRDHRSVQNEEHTFIPRRLLQTLKNAIHHGVEALRVDRSSGNRVEEMNRI